MEKEEWVSAYERKTETKSKIRERELRDKGRGRLNMKREN